MLLTDAMRRFWNVAFHNLSVLCYVCVNFEHSNQFAFFDFSVGKRHQTMARARVETAKRTLQTGIAQAEAAKVTPRTGLSPKCDHRILLIFRFGACRGGNSQIVL